MKKQYCEISLAWVYFGAGPKTLRISPSLAMAEFSVKSLALFMWLRKFEACSQICWPPFWWHLGIKSTDGPDVRASSLDLLTWCTKHCQAYSPGIVYVHVIVYNQKLRPLLKFQINTYRYVIEIWSTTVQGKWLISEVRSSQKLAKLSFISQWVWMFRPTVLYIRTSPGAGPVGKLAMIHFRH